MTLALRYGSATHRGRVRTLNEDALLAKDGVFVIADGMGGHAAGEIASRIAVMQFDLADRHQVPTTQDYLRVIEDVNHAILTAAAQQPSQRGMGTTVAVLARVDVAGAAHWLVLHVGDSRVYRVWQGRLEPLTVDHSEVEELIAAGKITPDEARTHPRRNVVTRSLGSEPAPEPEIRLFPPEAGERFILCTDGLNGELFDGQIAALARSNAAPQAAADALVEGALEAGGRDNVSVIVVDLLSVGHDDEPDVGDGPTKPRSEALRER